jgi:hypothetical protein
MGITERKDQTIKALFSKYLWTENGILTESGDKTFWDRATLYAFRGMFAAGSVDRCMPYFDHYAATRLLGEHVPYSVEAWPEGGQRHLSAENALFCRSVTEGLFGITPVGLRSFEMAPRLPKGWSQMALKNVQAFGSSFDINVVRDGAFEKINIVSGNVPLVKYRWDGKAPIKVKLPGTPADKIDN